MSNYPPLYFFFEKYTILFSLILEPSPFPMPMTSPLPLS